MIRVLLIEDDKVEYKLIKNILESYSNPSFEVKWEECINKVTGNFLSYFDVVLLDLSLTLYSGLDTLKKFQEFIPDDIFNNIPIIIFTSLIDDKIGLQCIRHGASDYIYKGNYKNDEDRNSLRHSIITAISRSKNLRILDNLVNEFKL